MSRARDGLPDQAARRHPQGRSATATRPVVTGARVRRGDGWHRVTDHGGAARRRSREMEGLLLDLVRGRAAGATPGAGAAELRASATSRSSGSSRTSSRRRGRSCRAASRSCESSNQELRVVNEEVMSVNEELRSSNEELETSKEELQSLNEELNTVNAQLEDKVSELEQANNDLDNLLTSTNIATIFLDTSFHVRRFTPAATRLFDLMPADVGRPIGDVARRCTDPELLRDAEAVLASPERDQQGGPGRGRPVVRPAGAALSHARQPHRGGGDHLLGRRRGGAAGGTAATPRPSWTRSASRCWCWTPTCACCRRTVPSTRRSGSRPRRPSAGTCYELGDGSWTCPRLRALLGEILPRAGARWPTSRSSTSSRSIGRRITAAERAYPRTPRRTART